MMVKYSLITSIYAIALVLVGTDASLQVTATPAEIAVDLTLSLTVNCTFSQANTSITNFISLIIAKGQEFNGSPGFQELVSVTQFTPDQTTFINPVNATASGHIDITGLSYISLQWSFPRQSEAGLYRCSALGMDQFGHSVDLDSTAQVTADHADISTLTEQIKQQQIQIDGMSKQLTSLTAALDSVYGSINSLTSSLTSQMKALIHITTVTTAFHGSAVYNGRYYLLSKTNPSTNETAQSSCFSQGGYLAELNDADEHNFVRSFLDLGIAGSFSDALVGGTKRSQDGKWIFPRSDQEINYMDWASGEPGSQDCLYVVKRDNWSMADGFCTSFYAVDSYLCEIPLSQ